MVVVVVVLVVHAQCERNKNAKSGGISVLRIRRTKSFKM
jgi:hypothetical protein